MPAAHISELARAQSPINVACPSFTLQCHLAAQYALNQSCPTFLVLNDDSKLDEVSTLLKNLVQSKIPILEWRPWEASPYSTVVPSLSGRTQRLRALFQASFKTSDPAILIVTPHGLAQPTVPKETFQALSITISSGFDLGNRDVFFSKLRGMGYVRAEQVNDPGQFSARGEIVDLFSPQMDLPIRITLFDTEIENIRLFNPETQVSLPEDHTNQVFHLIPAEEVSLTDSTQSETLERVKQFCDSISISRKVRDPIFENIRNGFLPENFRQWVPFVFNVPGTILDYHDPKSKLVILDRGSTLSQFDLFLKEQQLNYEHHLETLPSQHRIVPSFESLFKCAPEARSALKVASLHVTTSTTEETPLDLHFQTISPNEISAASIHDWAQEEFQIWIGSKNLSQKERIQFDLRSTFSSASLANRVHIIDCSLSESVIVPADKLVFISESHLLPKGHFKGTTSARTKTPKEKTDPALTFAHTGDLSVGDFVVHTIHGVGKFNGLTRLREGMEEYLLIEYSGGDKLYLPVYRLNVIQKYVGAQGSPHVDKLGGNHFEKTKSKARESAKKLAINLIEIYAKRTITKGPSVFARDDLYYKFCDEFPYTETEGQTAAIEDMVADFEQGKLLDRLVCGDVGFGKTEVAMRAAFMAVQSGLQVAVLAPTTLLSFQHEQTFRARMEKFPVRIESISRFKSKKIQKNILEDLKSGKIDILIGTHRILSKDVAWSKLGLLIVDEEHRFGVEHKEKIKSFQANVHTLTLTATPIPRTLNQALSGIKDISLMKAPPSNRLPIKTFVARYSDELVVNAISQEVQRGGQVFYLYNRVQTIEKFASELREKLPHVKIIVAHGQMTDDEMETRMIEFYHGHAQVLVCTTIIESGIDIPNAGTILVHRADQLGLSQLYQIRGRVGRSQKRSFAYLLLDEEREATAEAKQRLEALQRFVDLGSGFQIASEDLEIRGGGNLLGPEQSGHVASVGLELFTELLNEAVEELRGKTETVEDRHFEPEIKSPVTAEIPNHYVTDIQTRINLYRKLSRANSIEQVDEMKTEVMDRFGAVPESFENLIWVIKLKQLAKAARLESIAISKERTTLTAKNLSLIEPDRAIQLASGPKGIRDPRIQLIPPQKINVSFNFVSLKNHFFELEQIIRKLAPKAFEKVDSTATL